MLRADDGAMFDGLQIQIQQNAVVEFGAGEQKFPFVEFLAAFFGIRSLARAVLFRFRLHTRAAQFHVLKQSQFQLSAFRLRALGAYSS